MKNTNWKEYGFTEDGQFACSLCKGNKTVTITRKELPETIKCVVCDGSGYLIDELCNEMKHQEYYTKKTQLALDKLISWVRTTSKCTLCHGDSYKTWGGSNCNECGLEGTQPWGG